MLILVSAARVIARLNFVPLCLLLCALSAPMGFGKTPGAAGDSLYQLSSVWKDQKGEKFRWQDLQNKVVLLSMVYTSCQQTCPLILGELAAIQKALPEKVQDQVQVLVFSFDPERDTEQRLAQYAKERTLHPGWRLLRAPGDDVQELAAVLGIRYKKLESGDFAHSNVVTVLDQRGRISHQQAELFKGREQTIEAIRTLLQAAARR